MSIPIKRHRKTLIVLFILKRKLLRQNAPNLSEDSTDESIQEINNKKAVNPVIDESESLNEGNIATYKEQETEKINLSFESKPEKNASEKDIKSCNQ